MSSLSAAQCAASSGSGARTRRRSAEIAKTPARTDARSRHQCCSEFVSLAEARERALANRKIARQGGDPLAATRRALASRPSRRLPAR